MPRKAHPPIRAIEVEGNNGGSYVRIEEVREGVVELSVGETCVTTVKQEISVVALAGILTRARDIGFRKMLQELDWSPEVLKLAEPFDPPAKRGYR